MVIGGTSHLNKGQKRQFFEFFFLSLCVFDLFICVCYISVCVFERDSIKLYAKFVERRQLESDPFGSFKKMKKLKREKTLC